ncbi:TPR-like protein, partial [Martensiomyces pterosporus]
GKKGRSQGERGRRRTARGQKLSHEIKTMLGNANILYVNQELDKAFEILCEVVRLNPNASAAWHTMALIRENQGLPDDALQLQTVAAHLTPRDNDMWQHLDPAAKRRYDASLEQALYCLKIMTKNDPKDAEAWSKRLRIQMERGDNKGVAKSYMAMIRDDPYNMQAIRDGAPILLHKQDDLDTPIKWFSEAGANESTWGNYYLEHPTETVPVEELGGYTYSDINMMAELRLLRREFEEAIVDIKRGSRFIQGRGREPQWENSELDDVVDSEYTHNELPIELRVKLGLCRMMLGQEETAQMHWEPLFGLDTVEYEDLFLDVGEAYADASNTDIAIDVYSRLMERDETNKPAVWERLAKCYREQGDLERAKEYAKAVIDVDPNDIDMRLWLGEVYEEMGQVDLAYSMIKRVEDMQAAERQVAASRASALAGETQGQEAEAGGGEATAEEWGPTAGNVLNIDLRAPSEYTTQRKRAADIERNRWLMAMRNTRIAFKKLDLLAIAINEHRETGDGDADKHREDIGDYCETAQRLYNDWRRMAAASAEDKEGKDANVPTSFHGQPFNKWFDMFLMYGKCLALSNETGEALDVLEKIFISNVFFLDKEKKRALKLAMLSAALSAGDADQLHDNVRWWCGSRPGKAVVYKLFAYVMASSTTATAALSSANMYKFIRRQLERLDPMYYNKRARNVLPSFDKQPIFHNLRDTSGQALNDSKDDRNLTLSDAAALHTLAGHIMLISRIGATSIIQYTLAYTLMPSDPSIALNLGVSYLIYSGKSDIGNRHKVVLQGMAYIQRYAELRDFIVTQEIAYNYARAFHHLGLSHLAVDYYQRVFDLPISLQPDDGGEDAEVARRDLKQEAAYNLAAIYVSSGSVHLARDLLRK